MAGSKNKDNENTLLSKWKVDTHFSGKEESEKYVLTENKFKKKREKAMESLQKGLHLFTKIEDNLTCLNRIRQVWVWAFTESKKSLEVSVWKMKENQLVMENKTVNQP